MPSHDGAEGLAILEVVCTCTGSLQDRLTVESNSFNAFLRVIHRISYRWMFEFLFNEIRLLLAQFRWILVACLDL